MILYIFKVFFIIKSYMDSEFIISVWHEERVPVGVLTDGKLQVC